MSATIALSLLACGGSDDGGATGPSANGPLALAAISGDKQTVVAEDHASLPMPVVFRIVQRPDGTTALIHEIPDRFLDLLVPRVFAQGAGKTIDGSAIAGASVCAHDIAGYNALTPQQVCVNSDENGLAYFIFSPGTSAGTSASEIRGTKEGHREAVDTATAVVMPGPVAMGIWKIPMLYVGRAVKLGDALIGTIDRYGNTVVLDSLTFTAVPGVVISHDTAIASLPERAITLDPSTGGQVQAYVVPDLGRSLLKIESMCIFTGKIHNLQNILIDSESVDGVIDSATYTPNNAAQPTGGILWFTAEIVDHLHSGATEAVRASTIPFQFFGQRPDTLFINSRPSAYKNDGMIETSSSPLTYKSTTHCWQGVEPFTGHVTLSAQ